MRLGQEAEAFDSGYEAAGIRGAFRSWLDAATRRTDRRYVNNFWQAWISAAAGESNRAFDWLERSYRVPEAAQLVTLAVEPGFDPLRSGPRFQDLLRRLGFPED